MVPSAIRAADDVVLDTVLHLPARTSQLRGAVVQAHGINADIDEVGMFRRLADGLTDEGFGVLRFSFRGHGRSDGQQRGATIAGEMLDLQAAAEVAREGFGTPLSVVAASFGAVVTCLSLPYLEGVLRSLVLWNPVLDLHSTFVAPTLPGAVENFGPAQQALLASQGLFRSRAGSRWDVCSSMKCAITTLSTPSSAAGYRRWWYTATGIPLSRTASLKPLRPPAATVTSTRCAVRITVSMVRRTRTRRSGLPCPG
ncbi:MAG: alpha/beta hydrolase [Pseudonocardiaceae bacterium]